MGWKLEMALIHADITEKITGCAFNVSNVLGAGFFGESV
jgi:hypothetical protein